MGDFTDSKQKCPLTPSLKIVTVFFCLTLNLRIYLFSENYQIAKACLSFLHISKVYTFQMKYWLPILKNCILYIKYCYISDFLSNFCIYTYLGVRVFRMLNVYSFIFHLSVLICLLLRSMGTLSLFSWKYVNPIMTTIFSIRNTLLFFEGA